MPINSVCKSTNGRENQVQYSGVLVESTNGRDFEVQYSSVLKTNSDNTGTDNKVPTSEGEQMKVQQGDTASLEPPDRDRDGDEKDSERMVTPVSHEEDSRTAGDRVKKKKKESLEFWAQVGLRQPIYKAKTKKQGDYLRGVQLKGVEFGKSKTIKKQFSTREGANSLGKNDSNEATNHRSNKGGETTSLCISLTDIEPEEGPRRSET